jgi:hypothetical protein
VRLEVVDGLGAPASARVALFRGGEPHLLVGPDAQALDRRDRDTRLHSVFVVGGAEPVWLDPGSYDFLAIRGIRHALSARSAVLGPDCETPTLLRFEVAQVVPTPEAVTADLHVHTGSSFDSYVPDRPRYRSLVAGDVEVVVISDHNRVTDPRLPLEAVRAGDRGTHGLAGVEARIGPGKGPDGERIGSVGHANFFPLAGDEPLPPTGSRDLAEHIDLYRARQKRNPHPATGEDLLIQLNHPRGLSFDPGDRRDLTAAHALFNWHGFDRRVPLGQGINRWLTAEQPVTGTTALDFDALEVLNRFSWGPYRQVRADWFLLMNLGHFLTGTGNSDSHALAVELAGFPVNLVRAPGALRDDGALDERVFVDAVRAGRVAVSTGPVVELRVATADGRVARPGDLLAGPLARVTATLEVRAAPWVPVHEVRLVVDGRTVRAEALAEPLPADGGVLRATRSWELELARDAWILAEAGWPLGDPPAAGEPTLETYAKVAPGYVPLGFVNPVRVDADGDGAWTPLDAERAAEQAEPMPERARRPMRKQAELP